jgi:hypothetical protein
MHARLCLALVSQQLPVVVHQHRQHWDAETVPQFIPLAGVKEWVGLVAFDENRAARLGARGSGLHQFIERPI